MLVVGSNMHDINVIKRKLANLFSMKDLGVAKKILDMRITRDRKICKLALSWGEYAEKVLEIFKMWYAKTQEQINYMYKVLYSSVVGNLMYMMVCTRPDIAHVMGVMSRYIKKSR
jgi:ATP-binding cassette subfamily B (MDR/TAP) protein 1